METFTKLGNVYENERETNKIDRIRKKAHFFLLEKYTKTNTSPVYIQEDLDNRGFSNTF